MLTLPKVDIDFAKYSQLGDYHWQEYEKGTIYGQHAKKIVAWVRERPVLDVGCGDGLITHLLGEGAEGIDPILLAVDMAKRHGVQARLAKLQDLEGWWPAVYCGDVLEHIDDQQAAVAHLARITNRLYLVTPERGLIPPDPYHTHEFSAEELTAFMTAAGWTEQSQERAYCRIYGLHTR